MFIALALWLCRIYLTDDKKFRYVEYNKGDYYLLSRNMYFAIFTICTAPVFLGPMSLLKYGLWIGFIVWLLFSNRVRMVMEPTIVAYVIFFLWLVYATTYSPVPRDAMMMLVKYFLPLFFLWLGYSALRNEKDLVILLKVVNVTACIYCVFIGGVGSIFLPFIYYGPIGGQFATYAPFADFLAAIFIVPIILYWLTKDKKYILCALWMLASTVLESVRTGLGGMMLSFSIAVLLRYKTQSLPALGLAGALFIGVILYVPSINEKFFGEDAGTVTATDIVQGDALSMENMDTNGRNATWEMILDRFYEGHEWRGSGMGVAIRYLKNLWLGGYEGAGLIHNDYVQLLAEAGIIGVSLLVLFYIFVIVKVMQYVFFQRSGYMVQITGIMALSSMAGIAFCMYFDNVVSNSMQSMIIPYIFLGFFLKMVDVENLKREQNKLSKFQYAV